MPRLWDEQSREKGVSGFEFQVSVNPMPGGIEEWALPFGIGFAETRNLKPETQSEFTSSLLHR